jgi:hypothetical protein
VGLALAEISGDTPEDHGSNTVRGRTVSIPQNFRRDKLIDKARVRAFLRYVADTSKQFLI